MNHIGLFLNTTINSELSSGAADEFVSLGDHYLTPVRCLFNGDVVKVSNKNGSIGVSHEKEYGVSGWGKPKRNFLRVAASIVLLIPGIIMGSIYKGLGYLFGSVRERHRLVVQHYTPVDRTVGSPEERLDLEGIKRQLEALKKDDNLNQPTKNLLVYAQEGTTINVDPGFLDLNPKKIILAGARIVHQPSLCRLDERLSPKEGWESKISRTVKDGVNIDNSTFVPQWNMPSVEAALKDAPRNKRVYLVNP